MNKLNCTCQFDVVSNNFPIDFDTINNPDRFTQVSADNGTLFEILKTVIVPNEGNLLIFDILFKVTNPSSSEKKTRIIVSL